MKRQRRYAWIGLLLMGLIAWGTVFSSQAIAQKTPTNPPGTEVPLFETLGEYHYPISTDSDRTQAYFDQGLTLIYAFNHAEAVRAFQAGIDHDPTCAMCYWGMAYALGPNLDAAMPLEAVPTAWEAIQQAQALRDHASAKEQALIQALAVRYAPSAPANRVALDQAYAEAVQAVHTAYPDDPDIAVFFAEAVMNTMPWDYWQADGSPKPETEVVLGTLEAILEEFPEHVGALHLYIHAVEKEWPERAEAAADKLGSLVPGAGHLVHMPSHIYIRIGRYHDAVEANQQAIAADNAYLQGPHVPSLYTAAYTRHNHHFAWFGAMMTGQRDIALAAARQTADVDPTLLRDPALGASLQHFYTVPLYTRVRFQDWHEILATPAPAADLKYPTGVWHYAQGMALTAQGQIAAARQHLMQVTALAADPKLATQKIWGFNPTSQVLAIAAAVLAGEIDLAAGHVEAAIASLQQAVEQAHLEVLEGQFVDVVHNCLGTV